MHEYILGAITGVFAAGCAFSVWANILLHRGRNASEGETERLSIKDTDDEDKRLYKLNQQWQNMMEYTGVRQDD